jgi:hypothetical protein
VISHPSGISATALGLFEQALGLPHTLRLRGCEDSRVKEFMCVIARDAVGACDLGGMVPQGARHTPEAPVDHDTRSRRLFEGMDFVTLTADQQDTTALASLAPAVNMVEFQATPAQALAVLQATVDELASRHRVVAHKATGRNALHVGYACRTLAKQCCW